MFKAMLRVLGVATLVGSAACLPTFDQPNAKNTVDSVSGPDSVTPATGDPAAVRPLTPAEQTTIWQMGGDPALLADRANNEGPITVSSQRHSCMKMKYDTMGRLLMGRGVAMGTLPVMANTTCPAPVAPLATRSQNAAYLYCDSRLTLGLPQYGARLSEATAITSGTGTKMMDLYATAASGIVNNAAFTTLTGPNCMVGGVGTVLFNGDNTCNADGISCLQGYQASADQVALCSRIVTQADVTGGSDIVTSGKRLAVAVILASTQMCE